MTDVSGRAALDGAAVGPGDHLTASDPETALVPVLDGLARAFGYERSLVALADKRGRLLQGRFGRGITNDVAETFAVPLANVQDPLVAALNSAVFQRVDDVSSDDRIAPQARAALTEMGFDAFVVAPLRGAGQPPLGVVLLSKGPPASDADMRALAPFADQAGRLLAQAQNVAELRQELGANIERLQTADQQIRMERDRLDLVLRNVPNPIIVADNKNEIVSMNAAAERLFKPSRDAVIGSGRAHVAMANDAKLTSFLAERSRDPGARSGELRLTDVDTGEELEMEVSANEVRDAVGATVATVSVMQDVGRLRELERRRLEQALFDSEKLAATGRLAASIAHEINNPLEAIQNALYLLVKRIPTDDPNAQFLGIAMKETERMSRILQQMLGFYRPAAVLAPTDLNALIEEAEGLVTKRLQARNVKIERQLQPDLPKVMASADQIKQVILNLILNAAEAMPKGGLVTVSTESHRDAASGFIRTDAVRMQVADTGPGIAETYLPHIFEPFFSTKGEKGTGLGLWVSLGIAQSHGGRLQVRNRPGGGTVFSMTLPIGGPPPDAA